MATDEVLIRLPISFAEALGLYDDDTKSDEDKAADLDYIGRALEDGLTVALGSGSVATFGSSLDRGRDGATFTGGTTYSTNVTYTNAFSAVPRVVLTVECGRGQDIRPILTSVSTSGFGYTLTAGAVSTTTCFVHWVAVSQG